VGLEHVAIEGFEVELHLAQVLGLELLDLKIERHQTLQGAMEEQEVKVEIPAADLEAQLLPGEAEVRPEFDEKMLQVGDEGLLELLFGVSGGEVQEV
jgi:hypothetical protein